eukprot:2575824-Pleurochrysis_carterae.AAC.3
MLKACMLITRQLIRSRCTLTPPLTPSSLTSRTVEHFVVRQRGVQLRERVVLHQRHRRAVALKKLRPVARNGWQAEEQTMRCEMDSALNEDAV